MEDLRSSEGGFFQLKKVGEDGDAVDSRTSSWALSSSPEVDEVVEDA